MKVKAIIIPVLLLMSVNTLFAQMFWNQTCSFAGASTSYISIPNSVSVNISGSFTIEAWVNPSSLFGASKGIISKGGTSLRYAVRLNTNGTLTVSTSGAPRLVSRLSSALQINKWTHIACSYNSSSNSFNIYINGALDTSATVAGAAPASNTDSLFVGISGGSTPFNGQLDEVRLWNRELSSTEVADYMRSTITATSGPYNGLVLSLTFQEENSSGSDFTARDLSGTGNDGNVRSVTGIDQSNNPYVTIHNNESVALNGSGSYLSAKDTAAFDATGAITLECWVYPLSTAAATFISKGSITNPYFMGWSGSNYLLRINGQSLSVGSPPPLVANRWTHLAFRYVNTGQYNLFVNGNPTFAGAEFLGNINTSNDSLYIGGGPGLLNDLNGFIDEVRITKDHSKTRKNIQDRINCSVEAGNDPLPPLTNVCYNLDGSLVDNGNEGGSKLRFVGAAKFSHPASTGNPVSPMSRHESISFAEGYYINRPNKAIPLSGSIGTTFDTLIMNENFVINDINVFVALNHPVTSQLDIVLFAPNKDSVKLFDHTNPNSNDGSMAVIFDDNADSLISDLRFTTFSPQMKPANTIITPFFGNNTVGKWILRITDNNGDETGMLYAWGIQQNNFSQTKLNLNVNAFIQGFYNPSTNFMEQDLVKLYLRDFTTLQKVDSTFAAADSTGLINFAINRNLLETRAYIQLEHRNSIETWSSSFININNNNLNFNFTDSETRAFGDNQILVDNSPVRFAIYGGDVNQDDIVDLTDITSVFNDANAFVSGYVATDVTGDNFVDLSDLTIVFNNSNAFVTAIIPE